MKKLICVLICAAFILCASIPVYAGTDNSKTVETSAAAFVLYCPQNGSIILSKNENEHKKPASTTKLLTSLITLEQAARGNSTVTFTDKMTAEGSSMYLEYGDTVKLSDLAAGMMMCSGNDAANAAAISISGSYEKFSGVMNSRAQSIGMKSSHFVTPSGLDDDNHYTTAHDMALLMAEVLRNKQLAELISQKSATVDFIKPEKHMTYTNHNRLLSMYSYCIGGKTGYTDAAGRCLVTASRRDNLTLICVTLDDKNDWKDHTALYEYGFSKLGCYMDNEFTAEIPVAGGEDDFVTVSADSSCELVVNKGEESKIKRMVKLDSFLFAPVMQGETVGEIEYSLNGKTLKKAGLKAQNGAEIKSGKKGLLEKIKELFFNG